MLIGLISDTHDNVAAIQRAARILNERGVGLVLHAGDHNSPFMMRFLKGLRAKVIGVYGNVDGERGGLYMRYREMGFELRGDFAEVEAEGLKLALIHGTHPPVINALAKSGEYEVVVHGHTHMPSLTLGWPIRCTRCTYDKSLTAKPSETPYLDRIFGDTCIEGFCLLRWFFLFFRDFM